MATVIRPEVSRKREYHIDKERQYELVHFCRQYPEWRKRYYSFDGLVRSSIDHTPHGGTLNPGDPTEEAVEKRLYFLERMNMVEEAAIKAAGDLSGYLLKAVTEGLSYEHIHCPCCREVWYRMYRIFFWLLDKARK